MDERVPLANLLRLVSEALREAHAAALAGGAPVMEFQECEVEFAIDFEAGGDAGLDVYVVKLGAGAKRTERNVLRVKYKALAGSGRPPLVAPGVTDDPLPPPVRHGEKVT